MPDYLQYHFKKLFNADHTDQSVQRSIDVLHILVGEEETSQIKVGLRSYVDELATDDRSPPFSRIFRQ